VQTVRNLVALNALEFFLTPLCIMIEYLPLSGHTRLKVGIKEYVGKRGGERLGTRVRFYFTITCSCTLKRQPNYIRMLVAFSRLSRVK
jgi:hypothetical protein